MVLEFEKLAHFNRHISEISYNGNVYSVRRLAGRNLLGWMTLTKPMHQDADTL